MKNFWPHRSDAKGFSIENLARKYREKISSVSSNLNASELENNCNLDFQKEGKKKLSIASLSTKKVHWANRDFSEYKDAA